MITNNIYSKVHFKYLHREWEETNYEFEKVEKLRVKKAEIKIDHKIFDAYIESL